MADIQIHDKIFTSYISAERIKQRVTDIAGKINTDYAGKKPLVIGILNGSFIFAADLIRALTIEVEISFVKLASYQGVSSTGSVDTLISLKEDIGGRDIIIVEDIVDSGQTMSAFLPEVYQRKPASVKIATFLDKPSARKYAIKTNYAAFEIENTFVVGCGLDYNGLGRNLPDLYILKP